MFEKVKVEGVEALAGALPVGCPKLHYLGVPRLEREVEERIRGIFFRKKRI
jgi:hypothetical protein